MKLTRIDSENRSIGVVFIPASRVISVETRHYHSFRPSLGSIIKTELGSYDVREDPEEVQHMINEES